MGALSSRKSEEEVAVVAARCTPRAAAAAAIVVGWGHSRGCSRSSRLFRRDRSKPPLPTGPPSGSWRHRRRCGGRDQNAVKISKFCNCTDMQENMWATFRDSIPGACCIHEMLPTEFPAFLYNIQDKVVTTFVKPLQSIRTILNWVRIGKIFTLQTFKR